MMAHYFTKEFWYTEGSIVREPYENGFWLVRDGKLHGFDHTGDDLHSKLTHNHKVMDIPHVRYFYGAFHWHREDGSWPVHPALVCYNEAEKKKYLQFTDEMRDARDAERAARAAEKESAYKEWLASATDLEKRMRGFDWTYLEADRTPNLDRWYSTRNQIFAELLAMEDVAKAKCWFEKYTCGYKGAREDRRGRPAKNNGENYDYDLYCQVYHSSSLQWRQLYFGCFRFQRIGSDGN